MNAYVKKIVNYIEQAHPDPNRPVDEIIRDCIAHQFSPTEIIGGLRYTRGLSKTKKLVAGHPAWGSKRDEWREFHDCLIDALEKEDSKESENKSEN